MRREKFQTNEYYHIYNRGVDKRDIFLDQYDYIRFLTSMREFNRSESIDSLYRLSQVKRQSKKGIEKFMHKIGLGYTNYFNQKYNRSGSLFQGTYKAIRIKTSGNLWRLSCYINGNAEIHGISKAEKWPWSSCQNYFNLRNGTLCNKNKILRDFSNINEYKNLLYDIIKTSKEDKSEIKKINLEEL
ncbi:hypothetical protein KAU09_02055 [Candidatus Parcubacteria bacterium]|nr:hypothetical protein [Candidatus Parcubacteria bacterium]